MRSQDGIAAEDADLGVWNCGQVVALIDDLPTCKELIDRIMSEAEEAHGRMSGMMAGMVPQAAL